MGLVSHVGMVRSENQDYCEFYEPSDAKVLRDKGRLLVVCDGMGGHNGGTIASHVAVERIIEEFGKAPTRNQRRALSVAIDRANETIRTKGDQDPKLRNMGTTCVAIAIRGSRIQVAHVGDSRAYLFRGNSFEQLTRDHTYLNDLIDIGLLTPEKAKNHPERNIITRCVGMGDVLQIDFNPVQGQVGDAFMLCSDGLYTHVEDDEMLDVVRRFDPQTAAQKLVDLANSRGGEDNITVAIVRLDEILPEFENSNMEEVLEEETPPTPTPVMPAEPDTEEQRLEPADFQASAPNAIDGGAMGWTSDLRVWLAIIAVELIILILLDLMILRY